MPSSAVPSQSKPFDLGVLLVHGIGTQPRGETLTRWSDALLNTIRRATQKSVRIRVETGTLTDDDADDQRPHLEVCLTKESSERWMIAEAWWAESFRAATYQEFVSWMIRAIPWSLALHIAQGYWHGSSDSRKNRVSAAMKAAALLLGAFALAPVLVLLLLLTLILGMLPIPSLRKFMLNAQSALTATVGDSLAFVESPVRAGLIRTRILDGLDDLKRKCKRTIVVAHSQGAAVVLDALGAIIDPFEASTRATAVEAESTTVPDTLVTFGAGTNQLVSLKALASGLTKKIGINPAMSATGALLVFAAIVGWTSFAVAQHEFTMFQILESLGLLVAVSATGSAVLWIARLLIGRHKEGSKERERIAKVASVVAAGFMVLAVFTLFIYADRSKLPFGPVVFGLLAAFALLVTIAMILSPDMRIAVTAPLQPPKGVAEWIDIYASADPVPNGPTRIESSASIESIRTSNRGSFFNDHTTYWDNLDGFVIRVARACAKTAGSPWRDTLPEPAADVDARAAWRVKLLQMMNWLIGAAWLMLFALFWIRDQDAIPLLFRLPSYAPPALATYERFVLLAAAVASAAWATSSILRLPWTWWVRSEQERFLEGNTLEGMAWGALFRIGICFWLFFFPVMLVLGGRTLGVIELHAALRLEALVETLIEAVGFSALSVLVLRGLMPPPKRESSANAVSAPGKLRAT